MCAAQPGSGGAGTLTGTGAGDGGTGEPESPVPISRTRLHFLTSVLTLKKGRLRRNFLCGVEDSAFPGASSFFK